MVRQKQNKCGAGSCIVCRESWFSHNQWKLSVPVKIQEPAQGERRDDESGGSVIRLFKLFLKVCLRTRSHHWFHQETIKDAFMHSEDTIKKREEEKKFNMPPRCCRCWKVVFISIHLAADYFDMTSSVVQKLCDKFIMKHQGDEAKSGLINAAVGSLGAVWADLCILVLIFGWDVLTDTSN